MKSQRKYSKIEKKGSSGYAYTNTRVRVMKSKLLKPEDMQRFIKMSVPEITRSLQEMEYKNEISDLGLKFKGASLIEYALNKNLENAFSKIMAFALKKSRGQIMIYLRRYDVANIKTILRGKKSGASNEQIINEIVASGELTRDFLKKVVEESKDVKGAIEFFKSTIYYPILAKHADDISKMEDELDKFYYKMAVGSSEKHLHDYISLEIAVKNYLNELRSKKTNINVEKLSDSKVRLNIPFDKDSIDARVYAKKMLVTKAVRMVNMFKRDVRPVLGYFVAKENEVSNLRILVRGKHSGLDESIIQKELVV
ncbi:DUF2764 family protein [archaeon]|nr:MAG: DUF2764 family protein [archaeon]